MNINQNYSTRIICPKCQVHELVLKKGSNGAFIGCKGYSSSTKCGYTYNPK